MNTSTARWQSMYTLRDLTAALFRQWRVATACFLVLAAGVLYVVLTGPKVYQADLKILVKRDRADSLVSGTAQPDRANTADVSEPELYSEIELIQGRDLLEQVVLATGLAKPVAAGSNAHDQAASVAQAVDDLRRDLQVGAIRKTWMIDVTYVSPDPLKVKEVLDSLGRLYLQRHLAVHRPPGAYQFFSDQSGQAAEELRQAQARLQEFGEQNHVVSASTQQSSVLQKLADFEGQQRQTEVALAEATRRIAALEGEAGHTPARRTSAVTTSDAGFIQEMQSRLATLESKRTELLQKYTPEYRLVIEIDQQIAQTQTALDAARRAPLTSQTVAENPTMLWLENEIARARTERDGLETKAAALRTAVEQYRGAAQKLNVEDTEQRELMRGVTSAEEKHVLYQRKQEEARISDALDRTRIANVAIAEEPTVPFSARRTRSLMLLPVGLLTALFLGVGIALAKDMLSHAIRTPGELEMALDAPVLAWVPAGQMPERG